MHSTKKALKAKKNIEAMLKKLLTKLCKSVIVLLRDVRNNVEMIFEN